ncbi:uncharacterized protein LOC143190289 isoform X2 [Rhynchophorus ferrugineus]|uniref:uncharacterized protein LOC143190289 isoform X2 n=1 Tax=Rhynchophorus ferrugineus TaxID=354439 RepID=UPI003FCE4E97
MLMDATVNDFLNEINQIAPKEHVPIATAEWQQCLDESTGYSYYWNTATDQVTWTAPKTFQPAQTTEKRNMLFNTSSLNDRKVIPPRPALIPSSNVNQDGIIKIYSLQEDLNIKPSNNDIKKRKPSLDTSDDEKIELITEYGNNSESEPESKMRQENASINDNTINSDEDDDVDLLQKIQQKARELKKLGGEVPVEVKNIIQKKEEPNKLSAISLVAGYNSDSNSEDDQNEDVSVKQSNTLQRAEIVGVSHSTLFPIPEPINLNDFTSPLQETETKSQDSILSDFHNKAFQRKRRIGVSLMNNIKKVKQENDENNEYKGLGFKTEKKVDCDETSVTVNTQAKYPSFQKGGVMFVKSDILHASVDESKMQTASKEDEKNVNKKNTVCNYNMLREKLKFLGEGRTPVLPVQVMLIQAETLFLAMEEKGLKLSYLHKWLEETCSELTKLEKEAAPEGWLLQWDRSHKRYFYLNQVTRESQWEYPQPDITRCDDAMDISNTPPHHIEDTESLTVDSVETATFGPQLPVDPPLPPSPPKISVPTPPPPPVISVDKKENIEPLPPGVESQDLSHRMSKTSEKKSSDVLTSALDSFYSEIAGVTENANSNSPVCVQVSSSVSEEIETQPPMLMDHLKKKKKKVKLAQGLTMKKKGVSELVEKWKNVQKSYAD